MRMKKRLSTVLMTSALVWFLTVPSEAQEVFVSNGNVVLHPDYVGFNLAMDKETNRLNIHFSKEGIGGITIVMRAEGINTSTSWNWIKDVVAKDPTGNPVELSGDFLKINTSHLFDIESGTTCMAGQLEIRENSIQGYTTKGIGHCISSSSTMTPKDKFVAYDGSAILFVRLSNITPEQMDDIAILVTTWNNNHESEFVTGTNDFDEVLEDALRVDIPKKLYFAK